MNGHLLGIFKMEKPIPFYKKHWSEADLDVFKKSWYLFLKRLLENMFERKVLEIGCGGGEFCYWLSLHNEAVGTDIVRAGMDRTRRKYAQNSAEAHFLLSDAQKVPFRKSCFDVVVLAEVLEHIPTPAYALGEIRRVLKPGGFLVLSVPNMLSVRLIMKWSIGRLSPKDWSIQPIDHKFTYLSVRSLIEQSGLKVKAVFGDDFFAPFSTRRARQSRFLKRLYRSWEKNFMRYFGRGLVIVAERRKSPEGVSNRSKV